MTAARAVITDEHGNILPGVEDDPFDYIEKIGPCQRRVFVAPSFSDARPSGGERAEMNNLAYEQDRTLRGLNKESALPPCGSEALYKLLVMENLLKLKVVLICTHSATRTTRSSC